MRSVRKADTSAEKLAWTWDSSLCRVDTALRVAAMSPNNSVANWLIPVRTSPRSRNTPSPSRMSPVTPTAAAAAPLADLDLALPVDLLCYTLEEFARKRKELGIVSLALEEGARL